MLSNKLKKQPMKLGILSIFLLILSIIFPCVVSSVEIGTTGSLIYPIENPQDNTDIFKGVTLQIENAPNWFHLENTSIFGPIDVYPGEIYKFRIDFVVGDEFNQNSNNVNMNVKIVVGTPALNFTWNEKSDNGLQTSKAVCMDNLGNLCSKEILEPDITPPITRISYFWDTITIGNRIIIGKNTQLEVSATEPYILNSETSVVSLK